MCANIVCYIIYHDNRLKCITVYSDFRFLFYSILRFISRINILKRVFKIYVPPKCSSRRRNLFSKAQEIYAQEIQRRKCMNIVDKIVSNVSFPHINPFQFNQTSILLQNFYCSDRYYKINFKNIRLFETHGQQRKDAVKVDRVAKKENGNICKYWRLIFS